MSGTLETYLLDANVFIQAKRRFYPFDLAPGYWDALCWHRAAGRVCSLDRVGGELERGGDDLWTWARDTFGQEGFPDSFGCAAAYGQMVAWVQAQAQFTPAAKSEFMSVADGWLAAYAMKEGRVLVTLEEHKPDAKAKVPLVNVCLAFGMQPITPFEMLRRLGIELTWQPPSTTLP